MKNGLYQTKKFYTEKETINKMGRGDWVKKVKGLRSTNWSLQNSHKDVKYKRKNIGNNIIITMHDAR